MSEPTSVLDASAVLAWLQLEPGALQTEAALEKMAAVSVVNWVEVLSKLADKGQDPAAVHKEIKARGVFESGLLLWPMDSELAVEVAKLRATTRSLGLSLGDRSCIALGQHLHLPILTADRTWKSLRLGVPIHAIR